MTDQELAQKVDEARGRVLIGFKVVGAIEGVNDSGRVLIPAAAVRNAVQQARALGVQIDREYDLPFVAASIPSALVPRLRALPFVEYVEPVLPGQWHAQDTTWNVRNVNAPAAWAIGATGSGAKLLILDSGIDIGHPDLAPVVAHTCVGGSGADTFGHGTSVAGVAAALNNSVQSIGVGHGVSLWSAKVGNTNGIVVVASVGNGGSTVNYPASLGAVVGVGAVDINNAHASFSNPGSGVDMVAPGVNVPTTCLGGYACTATGTSFAAPHVAAAAAVLKGYNPSQGRTEIIRRLDAALTDLGPFSWDPQTGYGLLNVYRAVTAPRA